MKSYSKTEKILKSLTKVVIILAVIVIIEAFFVLFIYTKGKSKAWMFHVTETAFSSSEAEKTFIWPLTPIPTHTPSPKPKTQESPKSEGELPLIPSYPHGIDKKRMKPVATLKGTQLAIYEFETYDSKTLVARYYIEYLKKEGWQMLYPTTYEESNLLVFKQKGITCTILMIPPKVKSGKLSVSIRTEGRV